MAAATDLKPATSGYVEETLTEKLLRRRAMMKSGFGYSKLIVFAAVLAISLIATTRPSTAKTQLTTEIRALEKYFDDLIAYDKECTRLGKRASLVSTDLDPLQRKSDDLKGGLSAVQNAVREIIRKLKAADEWNDLETGLEAQITDSNEKAFFQGKGFKRFLEDSANNLSNQRNEVSAPLDNLRKKLTSGYRDGDNFQIIRASYGAPEPVAPIGSKDSLGCTIGKLGLVAIRLSGGHPTNLALNAVFNQCWPEGSVSPF
jgi:hypothetical protein